MCKFTQDVFTSLSVTMTALGWFVCKLIRKKEINISKSSYVSQGEFTC